MVALRIKGAEPDRLSWPPPVMAVGKVTALVLVKAIVPLLVIAVALVGVKLAIALLYSTEEPLGITTVATLPKVGVAPVATPPVTVQLEPDDQSPPLAPV